MAVSRNGLIAALDVGSSKVCCFIARSDGGTLRVIGIGHQLSRGLRNGNVIDMDAAEQSIRAAVETAERMCGETIRDVFVSVNAGNPQSHSVGVEVAIDGHEVTEHDVALVLDQGRRHEHPGDREIVHSIPVGYTIDGSRGIKDPRGMACERLGVNMHVITAGSGPLRNLATCVARGHLRIAGRIVSPFAAGLACLVEDEMDLGVTLLDMGAAPPAWPCSMMASWSMWMSSRLAVTISPTISPAACRPRWPMPSGSRPVRHRPAVAVGRYRDDRRPPGGRDRRSCP